MSSSSSTPSSLFVVQTPSLVRRHSGNLSIFPLPTSFLYNPRFQHPRIIRLSASVTNRTLELSWFPPDPNSLGDNFGGWAVVEAPQREREKKKGLSTIVVGGIGSSVAVILATVAYFSLYRKGFKYRLSSPLNTLHEVFSRTKSNDDKNMVEFDETAVVSSSEASPECKADATSETVASASRGKQERVIVTVAVDSTQQEAFSVLKKLKIIEDHVRSDELCYRREYARWLIRMCSILERNPKHSVNSSTALSGSVIVAFDDVGVEDPDFQPIQALAEAGIITSKLSGRMTGSDSSKNTEGSYFSPDRFISRQDLINWKALVEYEFKPGILDQISRTKVDYMDVKDISPDSLPGIFMDMLAGEKSILRKVFGQSRRFQPNKPATKAQAAVALTSGRMTEAINNELLRLKVEKSSREAEMEEIRSELLDRGDIQAFWDEKLREEKSRGLEVDKLFLSIIHSLEQEKIVQDKVFSEFLKEKAAMDCQRQLLLSLKEEVNEMSGRLDSERFMVVSEQLKLQDMRSDLESKQEEMLDTKSILEAEIEALRILRSWVEDEARKSQARAKVLEEVGRRWKWDDHA